MALAVQERVVGSEPPGAPADFAAVQEPLVRGVPHAMVLGDGFRVVVVVPTGLATAWRDADPAARVSSHDAQLASQGEADAPADAAANTPARLVVEHSGTVVAAIPLVVGARRLVVAASDDSRHTLELVVTGWDIRAGCLRGAGDDRSFVAFAWRRT